MMGMWTIPSTLPLRKRRVSWVLVWKQMRRYIRKGVFSAAKVGRHYLIRRSDVAKFIEDCFSDQQPAGEKAGE